MKNIFKSALKHFFTSVIVLAMLFSSSVCLPAFAAEKVCNHNLFETTSSGIQLFSGVESWGKTDSTGSFVGTFTCYNNNLTPVKTITESGNFYIYGRATKADSLEGNVVTKIQIREYPSGKILWSGQSRKNCSCGELHSIQSSPIHLDAGQRIQIFFDVCSIGTPPGGYRSARISYYYVLT